MPTQLSLYSRSVTKLSYKRNIHNLKLLRLFTGHQFQLSINPSPLETKHNHSVSYFQNLVIYTLPLSSTYYPFYSTPSRYPVKYLLSLNFKRLRFFPGFKTTQGQDFTHLSLGLLNARFRKGKFFLKSKIVYLALASFFRKILLFAGIKNFFLHIHRSPKYFLEILNTLLEPVIGNYSNPFKINLSINEQSWNPSFLFHSIIFTHPKPYGKVKVKQRGRLKRKIQSRVIKLNRTLD